MLQLIYGRSGTGKTSYIYDAVAALVTAEDPCPVILLIPEQFSFETERALLDRLGPARVSDVRILSFSRLADVIFREIGGTVGNTLTAPLRMLLMSRAVKEVADRLTLYKKPGSDPETVRALIKLVSEFKQYTVTPAMLSETAEKLPHNSSIRQKTEELSIILEGYEALTAANYADPQDTLTVLAQRMEESHLLDGARVFLDGFKGLTEQEMLVMPGIMRKAASVTVTLCRDPEAEFEMFRTANRTATRLKQLAEANSIEVKDPIHLRERKRTASNALDILEQELFMPASEPFSGQEDAVKLAACADIYEESELAAGTIRRLMREEGLRCRDVAVVARSLADYEGVLDVAMERAGVPCFMDSRQGVLTDPLIVLAQSALRCVTAGFRTEKLLRMMKTGLLGFTPHSHGLVENYVFVWKIDYNSWRREWKENPDGLTAERDENTASKLRYLNILRHRLVQPLEELSAALPGRVTGRRFAEAVYRYLERTGAPKLLRLQAGRMDAAGEHELADRMARVWDLLMQLLDTFAAALGDTSLPAARLAELFSLAAAESDLGTIPQWLDAVQAGSADRIRFSSPKIVWILGANEGVFPAWPSATGLLSEKDRRALLESGLELADVGDGQVMEERYFAYAAVAAPSEKLFISYLKTGDSGERLEGSILPATAARLLPHCDLTLPAPLPESEGEAFDRLVCGFRDPTPETTGLRELFGGLPEYAGRLAAMDRTAEHRPIRFDSDKAAKDFFGGTMYLSPSRVESYHRCRFAYFCEHGLRVRPIRPADLNALDFGTLVHRVMAETLPVYMQEGIGGIRQDRVTADVRDAVNRYVEEIMGGAEEKSGRFLQKLRQLCRICASLLWYAVRELRQSRFAPAAYELEIGNVRNVECGVWNVELTDNQNSSQPLNNTNIPHSTLQIPHYVVRLPDGATVRVTGKIDRVDTYADPRDGALYVRVLDYKTGKKEFRLSDVMAGINLQMLIYLFAAGESVAAFAADKSAPAAVRPAGILYMPAVLPVVSAERNIPPDKLEQEKMKRMQMNGLLLDDPAIIRAMEADADGVFIPAKIGSKGEDDLKSASLASLAQFGQLRKKVEKLLAEMGETLRAGDIAAVPAHSKDLDPCAYCAYAPVCGFEEGDAVREITQWKANEVWAELGKTP